MRRYGFLLIVLMSACISSAGDWPHWRGPNFNGTSDEKNLPSDWSRTENIAWSVELPGSSASTPIISKGKIFISTVDADKKALLAMCLDRKKGDVLWQREIGKGIKQDRKSTFATSSPVTDGEIVVFFYASGDMVCYDFAGERKWGRNIQKEYGPFAFLWTFSSSPTIVDGILYLQVLQRDVPVKGRGFADRKNESYILAIDPKTNKTLWCHIRPSKAVAESREAFSTPLPFTINGKKQLVVAGGDCLTGHDLKSGTELWRWGTWNMGRIGHWRLVPSPVFGDGVVLACAPKVNPVYAIRPGKGVLDEKAVAWTTKGSEMEVSTDVPTPAFYDGAFFVLNDLGKKHLSRLESSKGEIKWSVKTPGRVIYRASPLVADGKVYIINHAGDATIFDAANGNILKTIDMDDPSGGEVVRASIVASEGQLFIRTTRRLYCVGKKE